MPKNVISQNHWHHYFENLQYSSKEFYAKLKILIEEYKFPGVQISLSNFSEGGLMSAKREYLTIKKGDYRFDCCAAPFGNSFFVSWWLSELESGCLPQIPIIGRFVRTSPMNKTFYQVDTETIFKASIHALILKVIDSILPAHGYRMSESARALPESI